MPIGQESYNRWRFAVPIFSEGFGANVQHYVSSVALMHVDAMPPKVFEMVATYYDY